MNYDKENIVQMPDALRFGGTGGGGGFNEFFGKVIRLEESINHIKTTSATKEDIAKLDKDISEKISNAIKEVDQKHTNHYKWIVGIFVSISGVLASLLVATVIYSTNQ
ncbi:MAG: hypothetical protein KJO08_01145 [Gammaproteobacteria bacterium]|nr:hypothetical protein [Gammaproteobacteria bacterium]